MHIGYTSLLLLDLAIIVSAARIAGFAAARIGQPPVIGEIIAGVLLGPTLLGGVSTEILFPAEITTALKPLAAIGLILFMFVVGYELERVRSDRAGRSVTAVSIGSMAVPFGLAIPLAYWLAPRHDVSAQLPFALFLGAALSITAFPVLARIIRDRNLQHTLPGRLALACAAVNDVVAWMLLAVALALAGGPGPSPVWLALLAPYLAVMFGVARPLLRRLARSHDRTGRLSPALLTVVLAGLLLSSCATEALGLHYIFGAFLFGVVMPREADALRHDVLRAVQPVAGALLLPVFFVVAGLNVDLSALSAGGALELLAVLALAIVGKLAGTYLPARLTDTSPRDAGMLAVLMNTRGLTEIVIVTVGLTAGILDQQLFSIFVIMAIVTTMITGPLLSALESHRRPSVTPERGRALAR